MQGNIQRETALAALRDPSVWDVLIIGGGATGLGTAVDAAARGYRTLLLEARDFASGTSSRSTKLIHGGVRYLRQGDLHLVRHALRERALLLRNAPHLVHPQPFIIPAGSAIERLFYGSGLKLYDLLAGRDNLQASRFLDRDEVRRRLPGLRSEGIQGGVRYWDGQFDDARLAIALMRSAVDLGAVALNYLPVRGMLKSGGKVAGVRAQDAETGEAFELRARVVINATGVHADTLRRFDDPAARPILTPSQGIHLVFDADFLPGENALLIPETEDGRVLFAIPWQGKVLLGTTDTPRETVSDDPQPLAAEVDFLLRAAGALLKRAPRREDIKSAFAGLRPLLHPQGGTEKNTAALSREHAVLVSPGGLVTVTGGKWTTYRLMAEDVLNRAIAVAQLPAAPCRTRQLKLHGHPDASAEVDTGGAYGSDAALLAGLPGADRPLHPSLPHTEAMVRFAARYESARTVEDILARRTRALFLDAVAATACIPRVAQILGEERQLSATQVDALVSGAQVAARAFTGR